MEQYRQFCAVRSKCFTGGDPFIPQATDVIIAGHPKSGTTWMQQILHQCRTKGDENFKDIYDVVPYLPINAAGVPVDVDHLAKPRLFMTHALYEDIHMADGSKPKFIIIIRDPYDSVLSFIKFWLRAFGSDIDMTLKDYKEVLNLEVDFYVFVA